MFGVDQFERIVIRIPNWVGDAVMSTPAVRSVRQRWPDAEITALCLPTGARILSGSPHVDRFEVYDRKRADSGLLGMRRLIRRVRSRGHDLAVALPNSFSSAWIFWRARVPRRVGTDYGGRGFMLTDRYRPEMEGQRRVPRSMVEHYADVLESIGVSRDDGRLELFESDRGRRRAQETLALFGIAEDDRLVAINPGASFGPSKLWRTDRFAKVADHLQREHGLRPILIGGPGEETLLDEVEAAMATPAVNTSQEVLDLDALKTVVRRASLMVTTDTGPRHYAVALGVPVVVVIGPTDPRYTESNLDRTVVVREEVECAPCHLKVCPIDHRCMTWIEADRVIEASEDLLRRFPPPPAEATSSPEP